LDKDHPQRAATLTALGALMLSQHRPLEAEPLLREALAIQLKTLPAGHPATAETVRTLNSMDSKKSPSLESASRLAVH